MNAWLFWLQTLKHINHRKSQLSHVYEPKEIVFLIRAERFYSNAKSEKNTFFPDENCVKLLNVFLQCKIWACIYFHAMPFESHSSRVVETSWSASAGPCECELSDVTQSSGCISKQPHSCHHISPLPDSCLERTIMETEIQKVVIIKQ